MGKILRFGYTNHRGEYSLRRVVPEYIWFGITEYHLEEQWLMRAFDIDKEDYRDFAIEDMGLSRPD